MSAEVLVDQLTVRHRGPRGGRVTAVDGVTLRLAAGSTTGLVGESGCGKSTLAGAVVGLWPAAGGRVLLDGREVRVRTLRDRRWLAGRVQLVLQDPDTALNPRMTVERTLAEAATALVRLDRPRREHRVAELLDLVGLPSTTAARLPGELSGGQRQRIALARALAVRPRVLVADEVTSALDATTQAAVLDTLCELRQHLGLTVLFISHSLPAVRRVADRVAVMHLGRIVESAPAEAFFRSPGHPYTRRLLASLPAMTGALLPRPRIPVPPPAVHLDPLDVAAPPPGCRFHPHCPRGPRHHPERTVCAERAPLSPTTAIPTTTGHEVACHFPDDDAPGDTARTPG
ncbi:ATP-binding cassette domain-containing protein [Streptomyces phaeoluteigriseus]|uniref:ATP-binding cassette domain-containing protein n=1 Tax=Streptomyces phaeoluteigriseus TaxID=114686 RepID=A0ABY4ZD08_9ACTN|nr:oligopeptide/dipeptide ABC transporter ATP-binding protein [Streptomyces phaeoluteigriseus]USQ86902.1 ATP-binding cassette domain-containing protein [Streptomyces phaeoluteigriseus]